MILNDPAVQIKIKSVAVMMVAYQPARVAASAKPLGRVPNRFGFDNSSPALKESVVRPAGVEPATTSLEGWGSIQLSYGRASRANGKWLMAFQSKSLWPMAYSQLCETCRA